MEYCQIYYTAKLIFHINKNNLVHVVVYCGFLLVFFLKYAFYVVISILSKISCEWNGWYSWIIQKFDIYLKLW